MPCQEPAVFLVLRSFFWGPASLWCLLFLMWAHPVWGADKVFESRDHSPLFVELYTSQGCSSCPPAERWMNGMLEHDALWQKVIPINFHVDYWDYIGWKDPFARKVFSARQRQYRRQGHTANVATPGFVVNGRGWSGWFARQPLPVAGDRFVGKLKATLRNDRLSCAFQSERLLGRAALARITVHAAVLGFGIESAVPRGENAGKTLRHDFVVVGYQRASMHEVKQDGMQNVAQDQVPVVNTNWQAEFAVPPVREVGMDRQALVMWTTVGDDPKPLQVLGGWL